MGDPQHSHLSHVGPDGAARMVHVGDKPVSERYARAEAFVRVSPELAQRIRENSVAKGKVLEVPRLAGIMAAKRADELIPLCHTLPLDHCDVRASLGADGRVRIVAEASTHSRTGVEMEALAVATVAALTVVDMGKAVDKGMVIEGVRVLE